MNHLLSYKRIFCAAFLLAFLFSGNVLLYSTHLLTEIGHDHQKQASLYAACDFSQDSCQNSAASPEKDDQGKHDHDDGGSCCESHSHASIHNQTAQMQFLPQVISHPACEPASFIPEVYLDKFIPPQNLV